MLPPSPGVCYGRGVLVPPVPLVPVAPVPVPVVVFDPGRRIPVSLADVYLGNEEALCDVLDRCKDVSLYLLNQAPHWLGDDATD